MNVPLSYQPTSRPGECIRINNMNEALEIFRANIYRNRRQDALKNRIKSTRIGQVYCARGVR